MIVADFRYDKNLAIFSGNYIKYIYPLKIAYFFFSKGQINDELSIINDKNIIFLSFISDKIIIFAPD